MEVGEIVTPGCEKCLNTDPARAKKLTHLPGCPRRKPGRPPKPPQSDDLIPATELDESNVREVIFEAFNLLGGIRGFVGWGRRNPMQFYQLWAKCGPRARPGRVVREGRKDVKVNIPGFDGQGT